MIDFKVTVKLEAVCMCLMSYNSFSAHKSFHSVLLRERERGRERERERETETERQRDRDRNRERQRQRERANE